MQKLSYMKSSMQNFRELIRPARYGNQVAFKDKFIENKTVEFKHTWAQMAHMHDLRVWTLTYAPSRVNNMRRLQEIHMLNQEMWYNVYMALWERTFALIAFFFFVTRIRKGYMKKYNNDSHDAHWRDTAAHM